MVARTNRPRLRTHDYILIAGDKPGQSVARKRDILLKGNDSVYISANSDSPGDFQGRVLPRVYQTGQREPFRLQER